jgi:RNA 2',3'-cyclic 3'-phosphodiesterase
LLPTAVLAQAHNPPMHDALAAPGKPLRLFLALWPGDELRGAIASWQQQWTWKAHAALVRTERLHLTLHFLGDVAADRLPRLTRRLRVPWEPFELTLGHGEVWPNGVAALRPESAPAPLLQLHEALRRELVEIDVPVEERAYKPHVTLARRAHGSTPPERRLALRWPIDSGYVLVRSLPGAGGYEILERFH